MDNHFLLSCFLQLLSIHVLGCTSTRPSYPFWELPIRVLNPRSWLGATPQLTPDAALQGYTSGKASTQINHDAPHKKTHMEDHIFYRSKRRDEANMATEYDRILDCTGLYCPEPVFRVRLELDNMESGQILKVTADDPAAEQDIKRLIVRLGHKILEINTDDENIEFILSKG